ncbi:phosphate propanoyltransferase [Synergistales bacterium]|nr:phosphate propanoyltransferase [Synergistales bacterium]
MFEKQEIAVKVREATVVEIYKKTGKRYVPVAISNRHVHLSREDLDVLFGKGYELTQLRPLLQPGQYASKETVSLSGPKGKIDGVRVLGPVRKNTQVEISVTDSFKLGIAPVVRMSGNTSASPGGRIETARGSADMKEGVIVAARHLHMSAKQAETMRVSDGQVVSLRAGGGRGIVLEHVVVRSGDGHEMEAHIDTDEANAALLKDGDIVELVLE